MEFDGSWEAILEPGAGTRYFDRGLRPDPGGAGPHFDPALAWCLAEVSRLVYRQADADPGWQAILDPVGLQVLAVFDRRGTAGALLGPDSGSAGDGFGILVFRGTMAFRNWVTNLRALPGDGPGGGKVHRGFRRALQHAWPAIEPLLDRVRGPLLFTGHSLGAALATLAAARRAPAAVYTFGSPRVGDRGFRESLAQVPVHRVVLGRDVVPTLPPPGGAFGFCHAGTPHRLAGPAGTPPDPDPGPDLAGVLARIRQTLRPPAFLSDHAPVNYVAALERLL